MPDILRAGQKVLAESSGAECEVGVFLGGGGQGEVYRANLGGTEVALKWYYSHMATEQQRAGLETLVRKGPPNRKFLWPMELASSPKVRGFGYLMPLRPAQYKSMFDLVKRRVDPSFRALTTMALELADSFFQIHSKGLCYCDISWGNFFFEPKSGDVLVCDNDNVAIDGQGEREVYGTPKFMAPEIVRGQAPASTQTDLYSLAVVLFIALMIHHPLDGKKEASIKCFDLPAMTRLYGTEPIFIFDPDDRTNEPVPGYHDNALTFWPIYPQFMRALFTKAFTEGLRDPLHGRVRESEWRLAFAMLRDAIMYCAGCGAENFHDSERGKSPTCWSCKTETTAPFRLQVGQFMVMLNHDTVLFPHHVDERKMYDFGKPVGEVTRHPTDPGTWGLKNMSNEKWVSTSPEGDTSDIDPGRSIRLKVGTRIHFGGAEARIIA